MPADSMGARAVVRAEPADVAWHPGLPVCASPGFLAAAGDEFGWIAGVDESGRRRCLLPYTVVHKARMRMVRFRVATIPLDPGFDVDAEREFLRSAMDYFAAIGADLVLPAANTALFRTYPDGATAAPYGTLIVDLDRPETDLLQAVHPTYRYNIRRAVREGVVILSGSGYLEAAHALIEETLGRSGMRFKRFDEFRGMVSSFGERVRILVADHPTGLQGCMVAPFSAHAAHTWYCGSKASPIIGSMHLLHWEAIRFFRSLGVGALDFTGVRIDPPAGSKQAGLLAFKQRFGGRLVRGYMWKYSFHPVKYAAYTAAMRLLNGGDIVDRERHKRHAV